MAEYGVRWQEFMGRGVNARVVTKEKFFTTKEARNRFQDKVRTRITSGASVAGTTNQPGRPERQLRTAQKQLGGIDGLL